MSESLETTDRNLMLLWMSLGAEIEERHVSSRSWHSLPPPRDFEAYKHMMRDPEYKLAWVWRLKK